MIRPTLPDDTPSLLKLTAGTGVFSETDVDSLREVLDEYPAQSGARGHRCVTVEVDGKVLGFAYFAPVKRTDRTWYLWWIVVGKERQAAGHGARLIRHVEDAIRAADGRLIFLETSSLPTYERTRAFYAKHGYEFAAVLKDYYAEGHDMVVYRKFLIRES